MSAAPIEGRAVNRAELAEICGVHLTTIDAWRRKGCPVLERGSAGKEYVFDTAAVIEWRVQRAVGDAVSAYDVEGDGPTKEEADRRRAVANAITAEIAADEALRQVVSRHDAEAAILSFCQVLKAGLSNAAAKVAGRATTITSAPEIQELVQGELNRAFAAARAELAIRWTMTDRPSDDGAGEGQPTP